MSASVPDAGDYDGSEGFEALCGSGGAARARDAELPRLLARYEPLEGTPVVMADGRRWVIAPLSIARGDPVFEADAAGAIRVRTDAVEPTHRALVDLVDGFLSDAPARGDAAGWRAYLSATVEARLRIQLLALRVNYDIDCETVNREQIIKLHTFNAVFGALMGVSKKVDGAGSR